MQGLQFYHLSNMCTSRPMFGKHKAHGKGSKSWKNNCMNLKLHFANLLSYIRSFSYFDYKFGFNNQQNKIFTLICTHLNFDVMQVYVIDKTCSLTHVSEIWNTNELAWKVTIQKFQIGLLIIMLASLYYYKLWM